MQFSCVNITAGQTRVLTAPDCNCTLVGTTNTPFAGYTLLSNLQVGINYQHQV